MITRIRIVETTRIISRIIVIVTNKGVTSEEKEEAFANISLLINYRIAVARILVISNVTYYKSVIINIVD